MTHLPSFRSPDEAIGQLGSLLDFWQWAMSDILGNRNRGILAEYIVGKLLQVPMTHPRLEWDCADFEYQGEKIEVKSSAYVQTWHQGIERSVISFGVSPHKCWDAKKNTYNSEVRRWAACYIFCLFPGERADTTRDVLDLNKWSFYVVATSKLNCDHRMKRQIGLEAVKKLAQVAVRHTELKAKVDQVLYLTKQEKPSDSCNE